MAALDTSLTRRHTHASWIPLDQGAVVLVPDSCLSGIAVLGKPDGVLLIAALVLLEKLGVLELATAFAGCRH